MPYILTPLLLSILTQTTPAAQPEAPALAGQKVQAKPAAQTIVSRDLDGKVRRHETSPEEAAAAQLHLAGDEKAKVDAVFTTRARILESFVENNLLFLNRLGTFESAPGKEKLAVLLEAFSKSKDLRKNGPLDQQVRAALPNDRAPEFDRLLKEYWNAIADEDRHAQKPKGRIGAVIGEKFASLGREVEAAYKRCERSGGLLFHYLFDGIALTKEQAEQLRPMCADYSMKGLDNATKAQQGLLFAAAMQVLDTQQQQALSKKFNALDPAPKASKGRGVAKMAPAKDGTPEPAK